MTGEKVLRTRLMRDPVLVERDELIALRSKATGGWPTEAVAFCDWLKAHNGRHLTGAFCECCVIIAAAKDGAAVLDYITHMRKAMGATDAAPDTGGDDGDDYDIHWDDPNG